MTETLKRRIRLPLLTAYGVGVMVGAGIYVLVGAVVAQAGVWAPLSFLLAGLIAAPTALSYSEFSTRIPEAAGEAAYVGEGFKSEVMAILVGLGIVVAGTVSAAAVLRGGVGYLGVIVPIDPTLGMALLGALLVGVAILGVLESLALAAVFTAIELAGLAAVIWVGANAAPAAEYTVPAAVPWGGVGIGAVLAFFAFIGFEDIVNMAEEVDNPERTLPRAILLALALTSVLYVLVSWAAVRVVGAAELEGSEQPLALVWSTATGSSASFLSGIAVFAALNGVLAQIVMAARVLFGLGRWSSALRLFHHVHPRFGTPWLATLLIGVLVVIGAVQLPVAALAEATSVVLLSVFLIVNLALINLKRRSPQAVFRVPMIVPVLGFILSGVALLMSLEARFG